MANTASGFVRVTANVNEINGTGGIKNAGPLNDTIDEMQLVAGAKVYAATRTLTGATNETLDLAGVLTDSYGVVLTFATVRAIVVRNQGTGQLTWGPNSSNGAGIATVVADVTDRRVVPGPASGTAYGVDVWESPGVGFTVTAGTGDLLYFQSTATLVYDIIIIGA